MNKKNIVIINRWQDKMCEYHNFIDHNNYSVFYIVNKNGMESVKACNYAEILLVEEITIENCEPIFSEIVMKTKIVDIIISLSEVDQEVAAYLRTKFNIPGMTALKVQRFRNKIVMKQSLLDKNILTPKFYDLSCLNIFNEILQANIYPLIIKPKLGVSSEGVSKINTAHDLISALSSIEYLNYECEEFIDGKIFHADGLIYNGEIVFFTVSEYINTCFEYTLGRPLGSVIIDDNDSRSRFNIYTKKILRALDLDNSAFHLEFILKNEDIYFLEIGARVGGASVAMLINEIYGINLFQYWIDIQLGNDIKKYVKNYFTNEVGGWLLFPEPRTLPSKVTYRTSLVKSINLILNEHLPEIGHVFLGNGEYRDTSGAYLLKGRTSAEIKNAIYSIIDSFCLLTQPIEV